MTLHVCKPMRKESHASVSSHRVAVACLLVCFPVCGLLCHVFLPSDGSGHHQLCLMAVFRISVTCEYTHMVHAFQIIHRPSRAHIHVYDSRYVVRMQWWHAHSSHCCFFSTRLFRLRCSCCWGCHLAAAHPAVARRPNGQQQGSLPGSGHGCSHRLGRRCVWASCTDNSGLKTLSFHIASSRQLESRP